MTTPTPERAADAGASADPAAAAGRLARPGPVAACLRMLLPLAVVLGVAVALLLAAAGAGRWVLVTEAGTQWLLARLPGVSATGVRGSVLGGQWQAERLRIEWAGGKQSLLLEDVAAEGLRWQWRPAGGAPGTWLALDAQSVVARKATLLTGPPSGQPLALPASLALPLQLTVAKVQLGELQIDTLAPFMQLKAQGFALDSRAGASHAVQNIQGRWQGLNIDGQAQIGHAAPLPLQASASVTPAGDGDAPRWAAVLRAGGPVARIALAATLRGVPQAGRPAPSLDLRAEVLPLQAWALGPLSLQTAGLDLRALLPGAPETLLSGSAEVRTQALNAPISAGVEISNAIPGRWNEGRLPLSRLVGTLSGRMDQPDRLSLTNFELALSDGGTGTGRSAGRWSGSALWQGQTLTLDSKLDDVTPQRLDGRLAAMRLSGPLALTLTGLRSPDPAAPAATPPATATPLRAQLRMALDGVLDAAPQPVKLTLEASADASGIAVKQARAQTGAAIAELQGTLQRGPRGEWALVSSGSLADFDPVPWLPGEAGSAWRAGPHRLSGSWQFDVRLPANAPQLLASAPLALAQQLAGNGSLKVRDSMLAGVPLQADAVLTYSHGGAPAGERNTGSLHAELRLGGNSLTLDGRGDPAASGASDRWQLELAAPQLAALAPLARLHPELAPWAPRRGSAQLSLTAEGRWPELRTEGSARTQQIEAGAMSLARGSADWKLASGGEQSLAASVDLAGLQLGRQRAEQLRGTLRGTLAQHTIDIEGALPLAPPAAAETLLGVNSRLGTRAQLRASGAWRAEPGGGGRWRAEVERLSVASWDGAALAPTPGAAASAGAADGPGGSGNAGNTGNTGNRATAGTAGPSVTPGTPGATSTTGSAPAPSASGARTPVASAAKVWADARDLRAELTFAGQGALTSLRADAGRVRLADTATLRWDEVRIDLQAEPLRIELKAELEPFAVAPLLARLQPDMGWAGDLRVAARLTVQAGERFDADVVIERSDGDLRLTDGEDVQPMGLSAMRLSLNAHDGLWAFKSDLSGRALGELRGSVNVRSTPAARWPAAAAPIEGQLQLRVADIGIWNGWAPPGWRLSGNLGGQADISGSFGDPRYTGELSGSRLGLRNLLQGVNVGEGEVTVRLAGETAQIDRFALRGGEGTLTVSGNATLGKAPSLQLQLKAERFRVLGRVDRQLIASGNAVLALGADQAKLDGSLVIDEGLYDTSHANAPALDDDVSVRRADAPAVLPADAAAAAAAARPRRNLAVNLDIDMGRKLRIRGRGLDTLLAGKLRLTTPGGRLAVNGSINTASGTYAAYGQKLEIDRGIVSFSGALDNPRLDILALRPNIDNRVGVAITGNLLTPRVRLFSEPELSDNEKLSWLVLGRAPDGLGRTDTALLQRAAVALLSGEGEAPTDALLRSLGIDELSLRQGDTDVRETVVSLGKQLSRRWYVGYERGVNATTGTWQLIYRIAQRFTLRAQSGLQNSLDVIWVWRVGETPEPPAGSVRKSVIVPP
jgi:translocation and assembly module TamB